MKEEEQPDGMFAEARESDMDLQALGEQMAKRKSDLEAVGDMAPAAAGKGRNGARSPPTGSR